MNSEDNKIQNLLAIATHSGLWLYGRFNGIEFWYSPDELRELLNKNCWCYKVKWFLRDPKELINELEFYQKNIKYEIESIKEKIFNPGGVGGKRNLPDNGFSSSSDNHSGRSLVLEGEKE